MNKFRYKPEQMVLDPPNNRAFLHGVPTRGSSALRRRSTNTLI